MSARLMREMFEQMVVRKDASVLPRYYHPEFRLTTNGREQGYEEFARGHEAVYQTAISYQVEYDDEAWIETGDRVAARVWITTRRPGEPATRIEVILIAAYVEGRIHRLWELTWPDWSQLKAFERYP